MTMVISILCSVGGNLLSGFLSDFAFNRNKRGRLIVATTAVFVGMILMNITLRIPLDQPVLFLVMFSLTSLVIPMPGPNTTSTIYDVTLPEVKTTANAVLLFIERIGSATAPLIAGIIAVRLNLGSAILTISTVGWTLCGIFIFLATIFVPKDIAVMREQMALRAKKESAE